MDSARAEYRVAKATTARSRARGLAPMGAGADFHYRSEVDYQRIGELAWDCYRNDEVVGQGVDRLIDLIFRDEGLLPDPDTGSAALDALIKADWQAWAEDREACDIQGESTLHDLARLAARHRVVAGDMVVLLLESGHLQGIEGYRMRTPKNAAGRKNPCVHGVVLSPYRKALEYWFTKDDIDVNRAPQRVDEMEKVRVRDAEGHRQALHIFDPTRISQTRGVSALVRMMETAAQFGDLTWATLIKAQTAACFAILAEQDGKSAPASAVALGPRTTESGADDFVKILEQIAPGMFYRGKPGEKLTGFSPNIPNAEFFDHARLILMVLAINLGIPVEVLLLDSSQTNFSGWRGAMDIAKTTLRRFRRQMVVQFYRPVYRWRVRRLLASNPEAAALASGPVDAGDDRGEVAPLRHEWKPPRDPYIEPLKDASADKMIVESGLDSPRNVMAARGLDIAVVHRDLVWDNKKLIMAALEAEADIRKAFQEWTGDWRDLLNPWRPNVAGSPESGGGSLEEEGEGKGTTEEHGKARKAGRASGDKEQGDA